MTGRYLIPFCIKSPFTVLLTLTPFVSSADTFPDKRGQLTVCILSLLPNKRGRLFFCIFSLFSSTQRSLFCVRHFVIFCFCYPYFLVFRRKNICLLFENRYFFYFYSSLNISIIVNRKIFSVDIIFLFPYNQPIKNRKRCFYGKY